MPIVSGGGASASSVGYLGSAIITANVSTASTTPVAATGLTVTATIPSNVHTKVTFSCGEVSNTTATNYTTVTIWDGAVGSGTQVGTATFRSSNANDNSPICLVVLLAPSAGTKTYNVGLNAVGGGTVAIVAGATKPALLLVEAI